MKHSPECLSGLLRHEDGRLYWRVGKNAGKEAGAARKDGRWVVKVGGRGGPVYLRYRVVWAIEQGCWPVGEIDHIDCDASNDNLSNLRFATSSQNKANVRARRTNQTGLKGVMPYRHDRFTAQICIAGRSVHLGVFESAQQAHEAYATAALKEYGEFARHA